MINIRKLLVYLLILLLPFGIIGVLSRPEIGIISKEDSVDYFGFVIIFYLPVISFIRVRSLGYGFKEFLLSFIPYYGWKFYFKEKQDKGEEHPGN